MTKEISTEVKTHVIIFFDRSERWVTRKQFDNIFVLSTQNLKKFELDDGIFSFSQIDKMISKSEYYDLYPSKRPPSYIKPTRSEDANIMNRVMHPMKSRKRRERFLKTTVKCFEERLKSPECTNPVPIKTLLNIAKNKLNSIKQERLKQLKN